MSILHTFQWEGILSENKKFKRESNWTLAAYNFLPISYPLAVCLL
jgi:hypothetical protein